MKLYRRALEMVRDGDVEGAVALLAAVDGAFLRKRLADSKSQPNEQELAHRLEEALGPKAVKLHHDSVTESIDAVKDLMSAHLGGRRGSMAFFRWLARLPRRLSTSFRTLADRLH